MGESGGLLRSWWCGVSEGFGREWGTLAVAVMVGRLRRLWEKVETFGFGLRVVPHAHYVRVGLIARA